MFFFRRNISLDFLETSYFKERVKEKRYELYCNQIATIIMYRYLQRLGSHGEEFLLEHKRIVFSLLPWENLLNEKSLRAICGTEYRPEYLEKFNLIKSDVLNEMLCFDVESRVSLVADEADEADPKRAKCSVITDIGNLDIIDYLKNTRNDTRVIIQPYALRKEGRTPKQVRVTMEMLNRYINATLKSIRVMPSILLREKLGIESRAWNEGFGLYAVNNTNETLVIENLTIPFYGNHRYFRRSDISPYMAPT